MNAVIPLRGPVSLPRCTFKKLGKGDCSQPVVRTASGHLSATNACYYHEKVLTGLLAVQRLADYNESPRFQEVRGAGLAMNAKAEKTRSAARAAGR